MEHEHLSTLDFHSLWCVRRRPITTHLHSLEIRELCIVEYSNYSRWISVCQGVNHIFVEQYGVVRAVIRRPIPFAMTAPFVL